MFALGVSSLVGKDKVQSRLLDGEVLDNIARIQPYGFSHKPKPGSQTYVMFPAGDRSYGVALIVGDKRYQMELAEGEVALHDDSGQSIALKRNGIAISGAGNNVSVSGSPKVTVTGGDVVADGISLKNHLHNAKGQPIYGGVGEVGLEKSGGGGGNSQDLDAAITAADLSAVAAQEALAQAILAKNDAIAAKTEALLAKGDALIAKGLADGFAQSASNNYGLTVVSKDEAGTYASAALTHKNEAVAAALAAEGSASTVINQVTLATEQKTLAEQFASAALNSKNQAQSYAGSAGESASAASQLLTLTTDVKNTAEGYANAALTSKNLANSYATAAGESATLAANQVALATQQKTLAGQSASAALTSRNEASTFASDAYNNAQAAAINYTNLSTTVGNHTASISALQTSTNGLAANYGVTINNNGHVTGFALNSTAAANGGNPTSAFVISADKFLVVDPNQPYTAGNNPSSANVPFYIVNGVTYIKEANINELTIGTKQLKDGAVNDVDLISFSAISVSSTSAARNSGPIFFSGSFVTPAPVVFVRRIFIFSITVTHNDTTPGILRINLWRSIGGSFVGQIECHPSNNTNKNQTFTGLIVDYVAAGDAQTYSTSCQFFDGSNNVWGATSASVSVSFVALTVKK